MHSEGLSLEAGQIAPTLREAALAYLSRGWTPIPLRYTGSVDERKRPLLNEWRMYQHVQPTAEDVSAWWTEHPDANIALLCGKTSGLVVIDFDGNGSVDPATFLNANGLPHAVPIVKTGNGWHCYYTHPGGEVPNGVRVARFGDVAMDVRGDGGYVVAPPSIHGSGRVYGWYRNPDDFPPPLLPDGVRGLIFSKPANQPAAPATASAVISQTLTPEVNRLLAGVGSGERNNAAAKVAGYFLKVTKDEAAAWASLAMWNRQNLPPLEEFELRLVFQSIARREASKPREEEDHGDLPTLLDGRAWADAVRHAPPRLGIPAPSLVTLDEVGGIVPKDLVILAGRPGMGKSTVAWGVAWDIGVTQKASTIIFSTEMTQSDVARWMASKRFKVPVRELTPQMWEETLQVLSHSKLSMCDRGGIGVDQIVEMVKARPGTKLVIIDHVQRLQWPAENRNVAIEAGASKLKSLAKDHDCTIMILSQLNRGSVLNPRRPELHDLRESGGLEQEADAVIFMWSSAEDLTAPTLRVKFYLAKNRHGAVTEVEADFYKALKYHRPIDFRDQLKQMGEQQHANTQKYQAIQMMEEPNGSGTHHSRGNERPVYAVQGTAQGQDPLLDLL